MNKLFERMLQSINQYNIQFNPVVHTCEKKLFALIRLGRVKTGFKLRLQWFKISPE